MTPLFVSQKMPAATHFNCFKLLVISLLLSLVSSASDGYRLQFIDSGKRDQKIYQRFAMKFWTTVPTSIRFPLNRAGRCG
jgi:hypothetical protein